MAITATYLDSVPWWSKSGMSNLALSGTFSDYILLHFVESKCTEIWYEKVSGLYHFGPSNGQNRFVPFHLISGTPAEYTCIRLAGNFGTTLVRGAKQIVLYISLCYLIHLYVCVDMLWKLEHFKDPCYLPWTELIFGCPLITAYSFIFSENNPVSSFNDNTCVIDSVGSTWVIFSEMKIYHTKSTINNITFQQSLIILYVSVLYKKYTTLAASLSRCDCDSA